MKAEDFEGFKNQLRLVILDYKPSVGDLMRALSMLSKLVETKCKEKGCKEPK
jgi:hypothetical protein